MKILLSLATLLGAATAAWAEPVSFLRASNHNLNFSVVVHNANLTIYRSAFLGTAGLETLQTHLEFENLPFPKTIVYMNDVGYADRGGVVGALVNWTPVIGSRWNFNSFAIEEFSQQSTFGYQFRHSFDPDPSRRTYLDGHDPYNPKEDIDVPEKMSINPETALPYFALQTDGKKDGDVDALVRILEIVLDPNNQPVLFHCEGGKHRTGMVTLAIRHLQNLWTEPHDIPVTIRGQKRLLSKAEFEYFHHTLWMTDPFVDQFREKNITFIDQFIHDPRFAELQKKFGALVRE